MTTLIDTNVLIDIVGRDPIWLEPSLNAFSDAIRQGRVVVNDIVYAELSAGYTDFIDVDSMLRSVGVDLISIQRPALFKAGQAFRRYRKAGGVRTGVLPDFFIGAQAEAEGFRLLTRDPRRYRTYFPAVDLIVPTS